LRVSRTVRSDHQNIVNANIRINQDGWKTETDRTVSTTLKLWSKLSIKRDEKRGKNSFIISADSQDSPTFSGVILTVTREAMTSGRAGGEPPPYEVYSLSSLEIVKIFKLFIIFLRDMETIRCKFPSLHFFL